jgi:hypothetical protein
LKLYELRNVLLFDENVAKKQSDLFGSFFQTIFRLVQTLYKTKKIHIILYYLTLSYIIYIHSLDFNTLKHIYILLKEQLFLPVVFDFTTPPFSYLSYCIFLLGNMNLISFL